MTISERLLKEQIIEKVGNRYKCVCGSIVREKSLYNHTYSQKHLNFVNPLKDCGICCDKHRYFYTCKKCTQQFCARCKYTMWQCPYCREPYKPRPEPEPYVPSEEFIPDEDSEPLSADFILRFFLLSSLMRAVAFM